MGLGLRELVKGTFASPTRTINQLARELFVFGEIPGGNKRAREAGQPGPVDGGIDAGLLGPGDASPVPAAARRPAPSRGRAFSVAFDIIAVYISLIMPTRRTRGGSRMPATAEHTTTLLLHQFPVALRLRVKARAVAQGRYMSEVFAALLEKGLEAEDAEQRRPTRARGGTP